MNFFKDDFIYFLMNLDKKQLQNTSNEELKRVFGSGDNESSLLYGVSFYKQFPLTPEIKEKYPEINRSYIQKAICVVSRAPIFGQIMNYFEPVIKNFHLNGSLEDHQVINILQK